MKQKSDQLEDLQRVGKIFEDLTRQALKRGLFEKTHDVVIVHNALTIFNSYLHEQSTGEGKKHSVDNSASNTTASRNRRNISPKKTAQNEKPTTGGSEATGQSGSGELIQQTIPGTIEDFKGA